MLGGSFGGKWIFRSLDVLTKISVNPICLNTFLYTEKENEQNLGKEPSSRSRGKPKPHSFNFLAVGKLLCVYSDGKLGLITHIFQAKSVVYFHSQSMIIHLCTY